MPSGESQSERHHVQGHMRKEKHFLGHRQAVHKGGGQGLIFPEIQSSRNVISGPVEPIGDLNRQQSDQDVERRISLFHRSLRHRTVTRRHFSMKSAESHHSGTGSIGSAMLLQHVEENLSECLKLLRPDPID